MRLQNQLILLSALLSTVSLVGCNENGNSCDSIEKSCQLAKQKFDANKCECVDSDTPGSLTCPSGKHVFDNSCEDDTVNNCGAHDVKCQNTVEGWANGTCTDGVCIATECVAGTHLVDHLCENDDVKSCGNNNTDCTQTVPGWKAGKCDNGTCKLSECAENMHLDNNACVDDTNTCCGSECKSCNKNETCSQGDCVEKCSSELSYFLSIQEAQTYFTNDNDRRTSATSYAINQGADTSDYTDCKNATFWWLRSPGNSNQYAVNVDPDGRISIYGSYIDSDFCAVRPALWITLD